MAEDRLVANSATSVEARVAKLKAVPPTRRAQCGGKALYGWAISGCVRNIAVGGTLSQLTGRMSERCRRVGKRVVLGTGALGKHSSPGTSNRLYDL